jgi:RNA polymerase sigma-70 factor (ECF subfamily)
MGEACGYRGAAPPNVKPAEQESDPICEKVLHERLQSNSVLGGAIQAAATMTEKPSDPEPGIRSAWDEGNFEAAATRLIACYGAEIQGFLVAFMANHEAAAEAFAVFAQDLWVGLPRFEWRCTARAWAYKVARNAARRHAKAEKHRRARLVPLPEGFTSQVAAASRTHTDSYLRTEVKTRMQELRRRLSAEDQELLILRISRQLSWSEIAVVTASEDASATPIDIGREASRLRKRYQLAKERLRELARTEGLMET